MSEALVPAVATPESDAADATAVPTSGVARAGSTAIALPRMIVDAGPVAAERFLEFFAGRIANERTRAAYARAAGQFLGWCEGRGLSLKAIAPLHVAAYIRTHPGSVPTVKQHLAAIRMLCDWLVVSQVPAGEPGRGRARSEARRHQGRDVRPLAGRDPQAPRYDRTHRDLNAGDPTGSRP